jgi:hypothetical protein
MTTATYIGKTIDELWSEWMAATKPPRPPTKVELEARPGLWGHWAEALWDYECLAALHEVAEEEHDARTRIVTALAHKARGPRTDYDRDDIEQ